MAKLNKMYYYTAKKEKKLNCYYIVIPKELVEKTNLIDKQVEIIEKNNEIIIRNLTNK